MFHRETKVYNGEVSLFLFFLVFAENKMKEEKDENCENSVLHEIVKKMKYSSQILARARGFGGVCS